MLTAACLLLVLGCGTSRSPAEPAPAEAIRVQALAAVYARGSSVQLDLVNDSTVTVGSNACARGLEILVGGDAWGRLPTYDVGCFALYVVVEPGRRGRLLAPLPATLQPGTYRTYHELGIGNTRIAYVRYSGAFEVR
jgi:hypothetical protein